METSKYNKLKVYISGYGPFRNIKENPSHLLVDSIMSKKSQYEEKLHDLCELVYKEIYEVSVDNVSNNITKCHSMIDDGIQCGDKELHLLIHFGVNSKASTIIHLEKLAKNEVHDHIKPRCRINEDGEEQYLCKLDLEDISNALSKLGHKIATSTDAGTYLCNFIYYKSCEKFYCCENVIPLFIHIPLSENCSIESIENCFLDFLKIVVDKYIKVSEK